MSDREVRNWAAITNPANLTKAEYEAEVQKMLAQLSPEDLREVGMG